MLEFIRKNFWALLFVSLIILEFTRPHPFGGISKNNRLFKGGVHVGLFQMGKINK